MVIKRGWFGFLWLIAMLMPRPAAWANTIHIQRISDDWQIMLSDKRTVALAAVAYPVSNKKACNRKPVEQAWQGRAIVFSAEYTDRYGVPHGDIQDAEGNRQSDAFIRAGCAMPWSWQPHPHRYPATEADRQIGYYAEIHGRVVSASWQYDTAYLNFGEDWKTDFTVHFADGALKALKPEAASFEARYHGKIVAAKGWVHAYGGPRITIVDLEHLRIEESSE